MIDWEALEARPSKTYPLAICVKCHNVMVRRLPENTYHRHVEAARAGLHPLTHCPKCGTPLYQRSLPC